MYMCKKNLRMPAKYHMSNFLSLSLFAQTKNLDKKFDKFFKAYHFHLNYFYGNTN